MVQRQKMYRSMEKACTPGVIAEDKNLLRHRLILQKDGCSFVKSYRTGKKPALGKTGTGKNLLSNEKAFRPDVRYQKADPPQKSFQRKKDECCLYLIFCPFLSGGKISYRMMKN